jgi:hypothetical protein
MEIKLQRFAHGKDSTGGLLFVNGKFNCYTCEDQYQPVKVLKETCIPEGRYQIKLRNEGGMTQRYKEKFLFHAGMLHLQDVPGFTYVYIHIGNDDDDTEGCPLVGRGIQTINGESVVSQSRLAYTSLYNLILLAMDRGEEIWIEVT